MNALSKEAEQQALTTLEKAIELVNGGETPDAAITKAANEAKLPAPLVQRIIEAYNTSRTLKHLKSAAPAERGASFPIARSENIFEALFPSNPETATKAAAYELHPSYLLNALPNGLMKVAEQHFDLPTMVDTPPAAYAPDPADVAKRVLDERNKLLVLHKQACDAYREMSFNLLSEIDKAAAYFRQTQPHDALDMVEKRAYSRYGDMAVNFMDMVVQAGGLADRRINVKRAAADELGRQDYVFDDTKAPYNNIAGAMFCTKQMLRLRKEAAAIISTVHEHAIAHMDSLPEPQVLDALDFFMPKEAKKDMPGFLEQDRPAKVKEVYSAIKREHPGMPAEMKARIASRRGSSNPRKRKEGPPYSGALVKQKA